MLKLPQDPQDMPSTLPPHVCPHPSLCFSTPSALRICLQHFPQHPLCLLPPAAPYAHIVPFCHASDAAYHIYAHVVPSYHASKAYYHPYAHVVPSCHASNAAYHPYAQVLDP
ncbi:hypothetical protein O181_049643 [Austropuccinia psidii MF-1]|uniref:Uncharacterized protein n=1 Tax=Austropuccinia psidii MF-1 TaxID=1389203 RepID=A0A9Q3DXX0_9BASI|nr:hypothetical protein [Austropuccinia psidii MF-1]